MKISLLLFIFVPAFMATIVADYYETTFIVIRDESYQERSVVDLYHYMMSNYSDRTCDEWRDDRMSFYAWAYNNGWQPGCLIIRLDRKKPFGPTNCAIIID